MAGERGAGFEVQLTAGTKEHHSIGAGVLHQILKMTPSASDGFCSPYMNFAAMRRSALVLLKPPHVMMLPGLY